MGNIESAEFGNPWDQSDSHRGTPTHPSSRRGSSSFFRDDDPYRDDYSTRRSYPQQHDPELFYHSDHERNGGGGGSSVPTPDDSKHAGESSHGSSSTSAGTDDSSRASEITSLSDAAPQAAPVEVNISKNQKANQVAPEATTTTTAAEIRVVRASRVPRLPLRDLPFAVLFVLHLLLVLIGIIFLNTVFLRNITQQKLHNLQRWYPELTAAVIVGSIAGILCQVLFRHFPNQMARSVIWASAVLTLGASLMLISTSTPANLGVGVMGLVFAIAQGIYSFWIRSRIKYAGDLLFCSLNTARKVPGMYMLSVWVLAMAAVWLLFWSFGVVSALSFRLTPVVVMALLISMAWTLETCRNVVLAATARGVAAVYLADSSAQHWEGSLYAAFTAWLGSICLGSLVVPIVHFLTAVARGLNRIHVDSEFLFSFADCFYNVTHSLSQYANNWAYVQVALHRKPFVTAAKETSSLFISKRMDIVISTDLTGSFCVCSGICGGMLCVLVSGGWTFGTHKALASSVSVVSFFVGYFLPASQPYYSRRNPQPSHSSLVPVDLQVRLMMAVPQGAVCAHYVSYGQNPASHELLTSPIPERLKELLSEVDTETAAAK